jgi:hypothetical protein
MMRLWFFGEDEIKMHQIEDSATSNNKVSVFVDLL